MTTNTTTIRHLAKAATLTSIAEPRLALANRTSPMQHHPGTLEVGEMIDFFRNPSPKDTPGWRGPTPLVDLNKETNIGSLR